MPRYQCMHPNKKKEVAKLKVFKVCLIKKCKLLKIGGKHEK